MIIFYQQRCRAVAGQGKSEMTRSEKPKESVNLYKEYKKAFPGRCKSEVELLERLAFLLLINKPGKTGVFTNIDN